MKSPRGWFNIYFILAAIALAAGCQSHHAHFGKKQVATIRLFLETHDDPEAGTVYVTRQRIPMTVQRDPFLDESDVLRARFIDEPDGTYAIDLVFNDHGSALLDMTTIGNRGRRIAIFSHFPPPGTKEETDDTSPQEPPPPTPDKPRRSGWISAVRINGRLTSGSIVFTPDTTRAEAQAIVLGLNNVAAKATKS